MDGMISITNFSTPPNRRVVAARGSGSNGFNIVSPYHSAGIRASFVPGMHDQSINGGNNIGPPLALSQNPNVVYSTRPVTTMNIINKNVFHEQMIRGSIAPPQQINIPSSISMNSGPNPDERFRFGTFPNANFQNCNGVLPFYAETPSTSSGFRPDVYPQRPEEVFSYPTEVSNSFSNNNIQRNYMTNSRVPFDSAGIVTNFQPSEQVLSYPTEVSTNPYANNLQRSCCVKNSPLIPFDPTVAVTNFQPSTIKCESFGNEIQSINYNGQLVCTNDACAQTTTNGDFYGGVNNTTQISTTNVLNQDAAKRKLIQQQLVLLIHAQKCSQRQEPCKMPHCVTMRNVLKHMVTCREGRDCIEPHCASSKQIICHWRQCKGGNCAVCTPLKQMNNKRINDSNGDSKVEPNANGPPLANGVSNVSAPLENRSIVQLTLNGSQNGCHSTNGTLEGSSSSFPVGGGSQESYSMKEWHKNITTNCRQGLVNKLVDTIVPAPDLSSMPENRVQDLFNYALKIEKEMFEQANNLDEYYNLLAQKIYKIKKELAEKKQKRIDEQLLQQARINFETNNNNNNNSVVDNGKFYNELRNLDSTVPPNRVAPMDVNVKYIPIENGIKSNGSVEAKSLNEISSVSINDDYEDLKLINFGSDSSDMSDESPRKRQKICVDNELCTLLMPVLEKLCTFEEAAPFLQPVDPEFLLIPDYFKIIKNPMDLSTIKKKLLNGDYSDPWQFCDDVWLMFDNAWLYNRKNTKVYKYCTKLSENFVNLMDPVMKSAGYCCGERLSFTPLALICYGQLCQIPRDTFYYSYETKPQLGLTPECYNYCKKCFDEAPGGDSISLNDDPKSSEYKVPKLDFKLLKNDAIEYESFVECSECGRKWHQICAFHFEPVTGIFVCDGCKKLNNNIKRLENRFTAKNLPICNLSNFLEKRVNNYLRNTNPSCGAEVFIRVLASCDKEVEVKPLMKAKYCTTGEMPDKFPFRTKAIFAFEVIDGVDVCFFGLHVQEYNDKCKFPNNRCVYIAYLDSVHYFQPREHRTYVYHELLLGYLEYCKKLGFATAHIWACPPSEGDDYIFHCHPPEQKIPKPKRLQEWYKRLLDRAIGEQIVVDYKDIYEKAKDDNIQSVTQLPYFEGDYWPSVIEDAIKTSENDEGQKRNGKAVEVLNGDVDDELDELPSKNKKKTCSSDSKKHKSKAKYPNSKKSKKSGGSHGPGDVGKLLSAMEKHKEVFFVAQLHPVRALPNLGPIVDPDPLVNCEIMDSRDIFLSTCRERHWEFSSLRRAKWATLALCYELHIQGQEKFSYSCDSCQTVNVKWHCTICEDFDLCDKCYYNNTHVHPMIPMKSSTSEGPESANGQKRRFLTKAKLEGASKVLVHASSCRNANCTLRLCQSMRRTILHARDCPVKFAHLNCKVCSKVLFLCLHHAKQCRETVCPVLCCDVLRQRISASEELKRKKRGREMMRRINEMNNSSVDAAGQSY